MKSASEDIRDMLEADGTIIFQINVGKEPALPTNCISIFESAGYPPQLTFKKDEVYEYPSVQIRIRSDFYQNGWDEAEKIKTSLHARAGETWNGTFYSLVRCMSGPFLLDFDKQQSPRFILNFNLQRR